MSAAAKARPFHTPAIEFRNVSMSFDGECALSNVSFTLQKGEMILLTGASGSGKSVLVRLAIGLLRPDVGQIFVEGCEIEALDEEELLAIRGGSMGMVFQDEALFSGMTVYDNVAFRPVEHGWSDAHVERAVSEVLHFVGLENDTERLPYELSGGMRRRLEIARALVGWPSIMLYDEPTSNLDPITGEQILDLIIRARDINGISSVYVTKELHEIPYLAGHYAIKDSAGKVVIREVVTGGMTPRTKVLLLERGKIAFTGNLKEFHASELPSVTYLTHPENIAHYDDFYLPDPWSKKRLPSTKIL